MNLLLLLLITVPLITSLPTSSYPSCNPDHEFACSDSCIPLEFQCDHVKDCKSGEDEKGCEYLHNCRANDFMCRSGECISAKFKCNGDWDCADGSDENGCREWEMIRARKMMGLQSLPEVTTPKPEKCDFAFNFECRMSFECLPFSKRCNGVSDCVLGDDEEDCIDSLCFTDGYIKCDDDKHCVHEDHFCDGIANCPDGSDEKNCHFKYLPSPDEFFNTIQNCSNSEFHCLSGQCIHKKDVCNGVKDCDDGSDEEGQCGKCKDFGCSHGCSDSPRGPECTCPPLQFLSSDYRTCEVDDLCAFDTHECSQHCAQMYGDVKCYCSEGYDLVNTYECSAKPEFHNGSLFFVYDQNSVRRTQLFNDSAFYEEHVSPIDDGRILSLTFHPSTEQLFMVVDYRRKHRTELTVQNGVTNSVLLTAIDMKYVAIDWITGNIYYAVEAVDPGIGVCSPRGEYCKLLIKGEYLGDHVYTQHYGGLIFHPKRSQIIWLDRNSEHSNGAIFVADTDGQYPRRLDHLNIGYMRTIAIDYVQDHVYVAGDGVLSRIDLHTLKSSNVKADVSPRSMIIFNGHLYFVERNSHILRKRKFGSESAERLHLLKGKDVALAIDNKLYYDMYYNPCDNKQCSHMCVLDRNGSTEVPRAKCICPDQYEMVNGACVYLGTTISRVHLSNSRMAEFCQSGSICKNGGFCAPVKDVAFENPTCICPEGFTGLYCENALESHDENDGSVWLVALWILLGVVISIVVLLCIVFARFPSLRHRAELMIGMNVPIISSPLSKSDINSSRSPIILGTDVNTPPSVSRSQSGDLSSSNFPNPMYNAPSVAPLLTKPAYSESPGY